MSNWLLEATHGCIRAADRATDFRVKRFWLDMADGFLVSFWAWRRGAK